MVDSTVVLGQDVPAEYILSQVLNESSRNMYLSAREKGFYDDYFELRDYMISQIEAGRLEPRLAKRYMDILEKMFVSSKIALIHSELSEALEALRDNIENDDKIKEYSGYEAEMADTLIRVLDLSGSSKLNIGGALQAKLDYNKTRGYKHGKSF